MTNWPGLIVVTSEPASSTMPTYSWPIGVGWVTGLMPRKSHRSDPHTQVAEIRMIASVGCSIFGSSRSSKRTSPGAWMTAPRMRCAPSAGVGRGESAVWLSGPPIGLFAEDLLGDGHCGHGPRPADVEGDVGDRFFELGLGVAVFLR